MIVVVEVEPYGEGAKALDDAGLEKLKAVFPDAYKSSDYLYGAVGTVDLDVVIEICNELNLKFTVKPHKGNAFFAKSRTRGVEKRLENLETDFELLKNAEGRGIIQMHVPNFMLITFTHVKLMESCCTDQLQVALNEGWRMIAVCPPLDERRPTYILARYQPE